MNTSTMHGPPNGTHDTSLAGVLERLDRRLARLEEVVTRIDDAARAAPAIIATTADTFDALAARLAGDGIDIEARARVAASLLDKATSPTGARALGSLLDRVETLESSFRLLEQAPATIATLLDAADGLASRLAQEGIDVDARMRFVLRLVERLTGPRTSASLESLLDSSLLDARSVATLDRVAHALATAGERPVPPVGAWGALRALGDPDIQHALGFLLTIAKELGHAITSAHGHQLPASPAQH